jgi:hypothetical protein
MQKKENVSAVSTQSNSMNFVLCFYGTKQDPNGTISKKVQVQNTGYNIWFCSKPFVNQSF